MKYAVTFTQYSYYEVDAKTESDAIDRAYIQFRRDALYPVARTHYDEVDVEEIEDEGDYE